MIILGIDPGVTGGLVWIDENCKIIRQMIMPVVKEQFGKMEKNVLDINKFAELIYSDFTQPDYIVIERAQPHGKSKRIRRINNFGQFEEVGGQDTPFTAYSVGRMYGELRGVSVGLGFKMVTVHPLTWQSKIITIRGGESKKKICDYCRGRWPGHDFTATERSRKPHQGILDAACIAEYGRWYLIARGTPEYPRFGKIGEPCTICR